MKKNVKRKVEKLVKRDELVEQGMIVRLNQYTTEYIALEEEKEKYYRQNIGKADRVVIQTLYLRQVYIDSLIKKICKLTDTLVSLKIEFKNDCAMQIFNYYNPRIKRGLSNLL